MIVDSGRKLLLCVCVRARVCVCECEERFINLSTYLLCANFFNERRLSTKQFEISSTMHNNCID